MLRQAQQQCFDRLNNNNIHDMKSGYLYILKCANGSFYTGSTVDLERRLAQHQSGEGANHTKKHRPVELVYFEFFEKIQDAFKREKQVQKWSRSKKIALINSDFKELSARSRGRWEG